MNTTENVRYESMRSHLLLAVPLWMMALDARGGPDDDDRAAATAYSEVLAEHGDDLIFGGGDGSSRVLVADLVRTIATLAWSPGGIAIFDLHFQSNPPVYGREVTDA